LTAFESLLDGFRITSTNNSSILSKIPGDNTPRDYQVALAFRCGFQAISASIFRNEGHGESPHARRRSPSMVEPLQYPSLLAETEHGAASASERAKSASAGMFASREIDATLAPEFHIAN
jgi:hypothetical protein